ncbi:alpha-2-macroglobulin family protein [Salinivirga cyanobacteriivorans]
MKTILLIFLIPLLTIFGNVTPDKDLEQLLKEAQKLQQERKYKSAAELALKIQDRARTAEKDIIFVQAVEIEINANKWFSYDSFDKVLERLDTHLEQPFGRTETLLRTYKIYGYKYWYNRHSYKLDNNADDGLLNDEPKAWSKHDIWKLIDSEVEKITALNSTARLTESELKQLTMAREIDGVVPHKVIDLALLTAITSMSGFEGDYQYQLHNPYAPAETFITTNFENEDNHPLAQTARYFAILLKNQQGRNATLQQHFDIKRLQYLYEKDDKFDKLSVWAAALNRQLDNNTPAKTVAAAALAKVYKTYASQASAKNKEKQAVKWQNKVIKLCKDAIDEYPESYGAVKCEKILADIHRSFVQVQAQHHLLPGKPFPVRVQYKNQKWIKVRAYPISSKSFAMADRTNRDVGMPKGKMLWEYKIELPSKPGYFSQDVIDLLPALPKGFYLLDIQPEKKVTSAHKVMDELLVNSTNLATLTRPLKDQTRVIAIDRTSGKQLKSCQADLFDMKYNYRSRSRSFELIKHVQMEQAILDLPHRQRIDILQLSKDGDTLLTRFNQNFFRERNERTREEVQFFADRSIYRPGQVIYFKAIATHRTGDDWKPNPEQNIEVQLIDANRKTIAKQTYVSGPNGSFSGQFKIPQTTRPGTMRLSAPRGNLSFDVQYYKRPVFDASWQVEDQLNIPGEEVSIDLHVKSFAGASIDKAIVETTVKLSSGIFKYWYPQQSEMVVASFNDTTNTKGVAQISFNSLNADYLQRYKIESKVTLPDGSSWVFEYTHLVSPEPLKTGFAQSGPVARADDLPQISIEGINGEQIQESVKLSISKLAVPKDQFYRMPFASAGEIVANKKQWKEAYPGMAWNNALDLHSMTVDKKVTQIEAQGHKLKLPESLSLDEGFYKFTWYMADTIYSNNYLKVIDPDIKRIEIAEPFIMLADHANVKPGESVQLTFSSRFKDAQIRLIASDKEGELFNRQIEVDGKKVSIEFDVQQRSEGQIQLSAILIAQGRKFTQNETIKVKAVSRLLDVHFTSIRDKIVPGVSEVWSLQVRKNDKPLKDAGVLASMYDMSLDQFVAHKWSLPFQLHSFYNLNWESRTFDNNGLYLHAPFAHKPQNKPQWYIENPFEPAYSVRSKQTMMLEVVDNESAMEEPPPSPAEVEGGEMMQYRMKNGLSEDDIEKKQDKKQDAVAMRTNFNETAFFYPHLKSDAEGNVQIKFEAPQSMTGWKLQVLAIDKDLAAGYAKHEVVTQKPLMVVPNKLRFVHNGDEVTLEAMAYNMTDSLLKVNPDAKIFNPVTGNKIDAALPVNEFELSAGESKSFAVKFTVPANISALNYQISATSGAYTDGELHSIPVYPARQRIINSMAIWNKPGQTKTYELASVDKLNSPTAAQHELTIEMTTNPVWMAIKALPAVYRSQSESAIQLARNFYITSATNQMLQEYPTIQRVLKVWEKAQPDALKSSLRKNEELRNLLLSETPWEEVATEEELQRGVLLEMLNPNFVSQQTQMAISGLESQQLESGAFSWRPGMRGSYYFTLQTAYYLSKTLNMKSGLQNEVKPIVQKALSFLKGEVENKYQRLLDYNVDTADYVTSTGMMQYFMIQKVVNEKYKPATEAEKFYMHHTKKYQNMSLRPFVLSGYLAAKYGDEAYAALVVDRLRERAAVDREKGIFWRENRLGWQWDEAPVSTQAVIIRYFQLMNQPQDEIEAMKLWLIRQKQGQAWRNQDASLMAIDALLNSGRNWLKRSSPVKIKVGRQIIKTDEMAGEAGSGYFKKPLGKPTPFMKEVYVANPGEVPVWGAVYHSFTEDFANIEPAQDEMSVNRKIYKIVETTKGSKLEAISNETNLKPGDRLRIKITVSSNRELDYVWIKSPHAACMEPLDQMSGYTWDGGLSYYGESHDNGRRFFIDRLNNGTYVLSYDVFVVRAGKFSAGPVEIQSAYAPEFGAHTGGYRVIVE